MGHQRNKKYTKRGWRKKNATHMNNVTKRRPRQSKDDSDKENTPMAPSPVQILPSEKMDISHLINLDETDVRTFHNMELVTMPLTKNKIGPMTHEQDNDKIIHDIETAQVLPGVDVITCSNTGKDKILDNSEKFLHNSASGDLQNECDDDTNWYENDYSNPEVENNVPVEGRRLIDIKYFYENLQNISDHNKAFGCTLSNVCIVSEKRKGLLSKFKLRCNMCNQTFYLDSEPKTDLDLNKSATAGIVSSGIGYTQFNEICASMDCPSFTQKHYGKVQNDVYDGWRKTATSVMEAAAAREREAAIAEGHVNEDGIACIDVIVDGVWGKRSFNSNFSALSGAAAIIGKRFGEVLFIGVKNKYCCICARAETKDVSPAEHVCYKNYSGSSTGMESDILLEGFKQSIPMHNLIYKRMVADGDSSTYKKILEGRPYPNCSVEKIECKNHIFRNMCKKLKSITTDTKYPPNLRKIITTQRILAIRKVICSSITKHISENTDFNTKVNDLHKDINNSYHHAFGNHEHCQSYYCTSERNSEDVTVILKTCAIWHRIKYIVNTVAAKARSLMHNSDSNIVESFNSIIAKFVGGKRINFSLRQGYESRCNAAVVSFNTKRPLSTLHKVISRKSPKASVKKHEEKLLKQRQIGSKYIRKGRKLFYKNKENVNDKDYGENCQKPDMSHFEYNRCKDDFIKNLACTEDEIRQIEQSTILQRDSSEWLELRRKLLTASNFAKVVNRRQTSSVKNLVKNLIYKKDISHVPSLKHGIENEATALEQLSSQLKIKIEPCGLFIDKDLPFLGASPDGVVGEDMIVEIKCPITAFKTSLDEAIEKKKVNFWKKNKDGLCINQKHPWYIQVQGQLHVTGRRQCIFAVWSGRDKELKVEMIKKDDQFWKKNMENKLKDFYLCCMLPELCDPRHIRNMPIRELNE